MVGQIELTPFVQVALETDFRRLSGIDNRVRSSAALVVNTARAVARFAADIFGIGPCGLQTSVGRRVKIATDIAMTFLAALGPDEFSARYLWRHDDGASYRGAGNHNQGKKKANENQPTLFAPSQP